MTARCALAVSVAALALVPQALAGGSFTSSDDLLNQIWDASVQTARDGVSPSVRLDRRNCAINLPLVILDGLVRDRCPYIGDIAVSGLTLLVSGTNASTVRAMIDWFASVQNADGSIPDSPIHDNTDVLIDYNAYWVEALYAYTLWTGDLTLVQSVFPNLVKLVDGLYPRHSDGSGLLLAWLSGADYAGIQRPGTRVAYFNAQYIRALGLAASLADWNGNQDRATAWRTRAAALATPFRNVFWDGPAGAFVDTPANTNVHPLDGNVFAILSGAATPQQQQSVLTYIQRTMSTRYGDVITDSDELYGDAWTTHGTTAIYPFISYYELLADYAAGADAYALGLIRREWGWMVQNGDGRMWETIDTSLGTALGPEPSYDHGWSSGAAPVLTSFVLGVQPASPGFTTFTVTPHPGDLDFARGDVPTPHGTIHVSWRMTNGQPLVTVDAPAGTTWANDPAAPAPKAAAPAKQVAKKKKPPAKKKPAAKG
jgi:hypothetical protein